MDAVPREQTQPLLDVIPGQGCSCELQRPWQLWCPRFTAQKPLTSPPLGTTSFRFEQPNFLEECTIHTQGHLALLPFLASHTFRLPLCWSGGCHVRPGPRSLKVLSSELQASLSIAHFCHPWSRVQGFPAPRTGTATGSPAVLPGAEHRSLFP